ncbi:hypothetical protein BTO32_15355 [Marinobacter lutaoensis]|uniref:Uncharacterized protein n=1 Tax=Marinobacter lutaoensis TaxID=135739 RepID=A0A1V2DPN1_9GAMM|nr:hypothetical protein [Marinobacter lutaoensis]ONF42582.1 hypothetical protein BTO32_15355 [Marinobacter lutaoensis]
MIKPDDSGVSIICGSLLFIAALAWVRIDDAAPLWFLLLLACGGTFLVTYPLFTRNLIVKGLIEQGEDPQAVKQRWKINLGFIQI